MRRIAVTALAFAALAAPASAHPLGNFSINHLSRVSISRDRVAVHYILDQAEIPTFQERGLGVQRVLARKEAEVERGLELRVDGHLAALALQPGARISFPRGQGGLTLTRVELDLVARVAHPQQVAFEDRTFRGRVGWKDVIVSDGRGTAVKSSVPVDDPTNGLHSYPQDKLTSPLDRRRASFTVAPGSGTVSAPHGVAGGASTHNRSGDGLAGVFADAADGKGVLLFLLLAAFGWGALHALSPGHGKAMVAAYLVGTRGTARHALALGATVTITHTIGVFALGVVTLALSQYVVPEDLYPWLTVASGLMVVLVGAGVLRSRIRARSAHTHDHSHPHSHPHDHSHPHEHEHSHGGHTHSHSTSDLTWRGLLGMGASAGLIPCPSALVVLLGAISQHEVALGLLLITAFSVGLAATLSFLGLAVVYARSFLARLRFGGEFATALPSLSAVVIVAAGLVLTVHGIDQVH
ncbi:MAG: nickel/cobalt transporter (NicO) family protein [Thermoleophilaceae bacterium]|jgi:ABC-type nickel/cobalt efflux system permease component RcnA|nr:nickel/cobalt transporter (NicO) family protein [Thermoleophilaceae bacterium]